MRGVVGRRRAVQLPVQTVRGLFVLPLIQCAQSLSIIPGLKAAAVRPKGEK
jgi:hypothetical protein